VYAAAALHPTLNRPQQALAKIDMQTGQSWLWTKHDRYYLGEPQFIARKQEPGVHPSQDAHHSGCSCVQDCASGQQRGEDDGWLMALCYDAARHQSELVVLDALDIEGGPIAVLPLRETIPHGLHGDWSEVYTGPA